VSRSVLNGAGDETPPGLLAISAASVVKGASGVQRYAEAQETDGTAAETQEATGNTNFDLNRRAGPRPYRRGGDWRRGKVEML